MSRCISIFLLIFWALPGLAGEYPKQRDRSKYGAMENDKIDQQIREASGFRHLRRRILRHSAQMVGANYGIDPLGEGPAAEVDTDPRFRVAPVDCLTFVETTLSMAYAENLTEARRWMDRLRYSGSKVAFSRRNHFMLAQWVPHLQRLNALRDITRKIGKGELLVHDYSKVPWASISRRFLPANFDLLNPPSQRAQMPLISLDTLEANLHKVPTGTILLLVRVERPKIPVRISHLGFVIQRRSGGTVYRHASQEGWGRVVDEDLMRYLRRLDARSKWAIAGVNLQQPRMPSGRPGVLSEPGGAPIRAWLP
jgi:hypothetical protein